MVGTVPVGLTEYIKVYSTDDEAEAVDLSMNEQADRQVPDKTTLERLGRERPATFPNKWIELCFCFSLLASELLAVCPPSSSQALLTVVGILHQRLQQPAPSHHNRPRHPPRLADMACQCLLPRHGFLFTPLRPSR